MNEIRIGDCLQIMKVLILANVKVQTCVTSPPYFGLRDYGVDGQIGLEETPALYVERMVEVFRLVRELLAEDGTLWLNLGDSYANDSKFGGTTGGKHAAALHGANVGRGKRNTGLKSKDLMGIPWRVAFALQDDGWYLRSDIIWAKQNPMPESVTDRPTKSHEYIFLLSKSASYFYDAEAIKEPAISGDPRKPYAPGQVDARGNGHDRGGGKIRGSAKRGEFNGKIEALDIEGRSAFRAAVDWRNKRSVWTVPTSPYLGAHFATFPPDLILPCVLAGSRPGDIVFDPFMGSGTTAEVAKENGRRYLGCELNPAYAALQEERLRQEVLFGAELVEIDAGN